MDKKRLVEILKKDKYTILTLNNPPVNVLSGELISQLKDFFHDLDKGDAGVKAVIITGAGKSFCAGADIKEIAAIRTRTEGERFAKEGQDLMDTVENSKVPVIAAINGACIGGGNELAMSCHIRIASENAWFSQPEVNLGIIPGFGGTKRLPRLVGMTKAMELILTGERMTAKEALGMGLLNTVVQTERLMDEVEEFAEAMAAKGRIAVSSCIHAVLGAEDEYKLFGRVCETEDKAEGIKAFIEKRKAMFSDR